MTRPEVFAETLRDHLFVDSVSVVGEIVLAIRKRSRNDGVATFSEALDDGWALAVEVPDDDGDVFVFVPKEWFE